MEALEVFCLTQDLDTGRAGSLGRGRIMVLMVLRKGVRGLDHGPMLSGGLTLLALLEVIFKPIKLN